MFVLEAIRDYAKTGRVALINREERLTFRNWTPGPRPLPPIS